MKLVTYEGGHGWRGDVFGNIAAGLKWLEQSFDRPWGDTGVSQSFRCVDGVNSVFWLVVNQDAVS